MAAPTVCSEPGCPNLTAYGRCSACQLQSRRAADRRRPSAAARGYGSEWRRTRARYLREHPLCENACGRPARDVHHIDGRGPAGPRGHDPANLLALCGSCHSRVTAALSPAGWNS